MNVISDKAVSYELLLNIIKDNLTYCLTSKLNDVIMHCC